MTIDGRLLLAVAAVLGIVFAIIVLALERRLRQPIAGLRSWAVGSFLLAASAGLHDLQGLAPDWVPDLLGNAAIIGGRAFTVGALHQLDRRPVPSRLLLGLALAFGAGLATLFVAGPGQEARGLLVATATGLFTAWAAVELALSAPLRISRTVALIGFAGIALANFSRVWGHARQIDAGGTLDLHSSAVAIYIGMLLIFDVLCNVGFVLIITDRMHDWVLQLARTDHLTGALSRGALYTQAQRDLQIARRQHTFTAAFIVDIDHFKTVNDTHGHATGDAMLRHVAQHGQTVLRCTDLFGRYGGDEFVAILPETDLLTAAAIAERLREAVATASHDCGLPHALPAVTVSIGVAAVCAGGDGIDELIAQADQALYTAKHAGRNRTRVADASEAPEGTSLRVIQGRS